LKEHLLSKSLEGVLRKYWKSFSEKTYNTENNDSDILMEMFCISPELKRQNRQYWGRELGMCWQLLVTELCQHASDEYSPAIKIDADEPCDLCLGKDAIDTKYRIGSGDSGTLKKFRKNGKLLRSMGYTPILLIVRSDNLEAAMTACRSGTWVILSGDKAFSYLYKKTQFDLVKWCESRIEDGTFHIER